MSSEQDLDRLFSLFAHDFASPMSNTLSSILSMRERIRALGDAKLAHELLDGIDDVVRNFEEIGERFHAFRAEVRNRVTEANETIFLRDHLTHFMALYRRRLSKRGIAIEWIGDENPSLTTHPGALTRAIGNLIENAMVHAFKEPAEKAFIGINAAATGRQVTIVISDNGCGMDEATAARCFDPGFTTNAAAGGTGLGLASVKHLVTEVLGGTVEVKSHPGYGTTFVVNLPVRSR